ncbi:MAG TPA: serine acetyltransferase [Staphylococcus ureilyticus]|uniref:serine O-acetyltransferase n=1 Tax=Staphylococcus ureilyticus TaxID=94138 RepID=UPI001E1ABDC3|nr:serine acetyltransferase [Staphylococcus ureilyticus]HJG67643.1 serine acetyltransferase [Staphylococcus ureilyticus]
MDALKIGISLYRLIPAYIIIVLSKNHNLIWEDLDFWNQLYGRKECNRFKKLGLMLFDFREFRNLVAYRIKCGSQKDKILFIILHMLYPNMKSLYIYSDNIGHRLFIQHGFSTIISAKKIGNECWINQQVTIGYEGDKAPVIGNHVRICAGAIIVGNVHVGNNSIIAAGAVVVNDVPDNEVWGGVPARYIKKVDGLSFDNKRKF